MTAHSTPSCSTPSSSIVFADDDPLRTESDVTARVSSLVGRAAHPAQLWLLTVDGDDRQTLVVVTITDVPRWPEDGRVVALTTLVGRVGDSLETDEGPGSVVFVLERFGDGRPDAADRAWAHQLRDACTGADVLLRGVWLATDVGVAPLR